MALPNSLTGRYIGEAMSREYRASARTRKNTVVESRRDYGVLAMPLPYFFLAWFLCSIIAAFSWDNLIGNTPGAIDFGFSARLILAVGFGLPGAGLVSLAASIIRDR